MGCDDGGGKEKNYGVMSIAKGVLFLLLLTDMDSLVYPHEKKAFVDFYPQIITRGQILCKEAIDKHITFAR